MRCSSPGAGYQLGKDAPGSAVCSLRTRTRDPLRWASASIEALWKETEDRLPDALAAMDAGTLFTSPEHVAVIKSAIALHFTRSKATWLIHARVWADTVERGRKRWLTEQRDLLSYLFYREKGLYPTGDEALGMFADELIEFSRALADSGALWRERIESLYLNARAVTDSAGLEILTPPARVSS